MLDSPFPAAPSAPGGPSWRPGPTASQEFPWQGGGSQQPAGGAEATGVFAQRGPQAPPSQDPGEYTQMMSAPRPAPPAPPPPKQPAKPAAKGAPSYVLLIVLLAVFLILAVTIVLVFAWPTTPPAATK
jgi:hypothetical protein